MLKIDYKLFCISQLSDIEINICNKKKYLQDSKFQISSAEAYSIPHFHYREWYAKTVYTLHSNHVKSMDRQHFSTLTQVVSFSIRTSFVHRVLRAFALARASVHLFRITIVTICAHTFHSRASGCKIAAHANIFQSSQCAHATCVCCAPDRPYL